jgi:hypothetical protein
MAGTMRMEIFPSGAAAAAPVLDADGVVVGGAAAGTGAETGAGDDSARRRVPFWEVRTWTSRFMGVWPCRSRNVGAVSLVLIAVAAPPPPFLAGP